jgi:predicted ATPase
MAAPGAEGRQAELVCRQGDGIHAVYAFKHALVQDAAYASLFQRQKRDFHRRIAETLEREFPGDRGLGAGSAGLAFHRGRRSAEG